MQAVFGLMFLNNYQFLNFFSILKDGMESFLVYYSIIAIKWMENFTKRSKITWGKFLEENNAKKLEEIGVTKIGIWN